MISKIKLIDNLTDVIDRANEVDVINKKDKQTKAAIRAITDFLNANDDKQYITAPQLGFQLRIFGIKFKDCIKIFCNPAIMHFDLKNMRFVREKCDGIDGEYFVPRSSQIDVGYQAPSGQVESNKFATPLAEIIQQCVQLLDGILISDIGLIVLPEFEEASEDEKKELFKAFIDDLKNKTVELNKEINDDKFLSDTANAINFLTNVELGRVKLEPFENTPKEESTN